MIILGLKTKKKTLSRKFKSKLKRILSKFNLRPKGIRRASIKHKRYKSLFVHLSEHPDNKESKIKNMLSVIPREEKSQKAKQENPRKNKLITQQLF